MDVGFRFGSERQCDFVRGWDVVVLLPETTTQKSESVYFFRHFAKDGRIRKMVVIAASDYLRKKL